MTFQIKKWLIHPQLWRFVCFSSTVIGLVSYALSSSFNLLFGEWNLLKIFSYCVFSSIICLAVLFAKGWQHLPSRSLMCKAHLSVMVLMATTVYSFFYDRAVNRKPDAYTLISCASFAIMSLGLSRQTHFGFEVDLLYFFLGCLILQLMKIKLLFALIGAGISYSLIILRSFLQQIEAYSNCLPQHGNGTSHFSSSTPIPSQLDFTSSTSNTYGSPVSDSSSFASPETDSFREMMSAISGKDLKQILISCAKAVADNDMRMVEWLMVELMAMVSVRGEPIQRLGAYMVEALFARLQGSGNSIYKALKPHAPLKAELTHIFYQICPYLKFGFMCANRAILEAMKDNDRIHIVDFQINEGSQWITLIQAFAARAGGPPHLRITAIHDSTLADAALQIVGSKLSKIAEDFKVPFEFHAVPVSAYDVQLPNLGVQAGEALAVNFAFMLHLVPENHRDRLLSLVKSLSPKVVTLVEQECNANTTEFFPRFLETQDYYTAVFESIDVTLPRDNKERINVEQHFLARDIVNIVACEGGERVERHELLPKWRSRFAMAGFTPYPLTSSVNDKLLKDYGDRHSYSVKERDGALYLGWKDRDLVASCAWKCDS